MQKERKLNMANTELRSMDRISELPEPIIHRIMSLLSTEDVTRISRLSKKFRSLWRSLPIIEFDHNLFAKSVGKYEIHGFLDYVCGSIRLRELNGNVLEKFRLKMAVDYACQDDRIDKAIDFAIRNGVKELDLDMFSDTFVEDYTLEEWYDLPREALMAKSIIVLKLTGFMFNQNDLVLGCPLIEKLYLRRCDGLSNVKIGTSCPALKKIELSHCPGITNIEIEASSVDSFSYHGYAQQSCDINILACKFLKNLSVEGATIADKWIEDLIPELFVLETLKLRGCSLLENIRFSNNKLKMVGIEDCSKLKCIDINVSNLESFLFSGKSRPCEIKLIACRNLKSLSLMHAQIADEWVEVQLNQFIQLETLKLKRCKKIRKVNISSNTLRDVELGACNKLRSIDIVAPSLQSFLYNGGNKTCKINITASKGTKNLVLSSTYITDEWLADHVSKLLDLESLILDNCHELKSIDIVHERLERFQLLKCNNIKEVKVDTPNLHSFVYNGGIISFGLMNSTSLLNAVLSFNANCQNPRSFMILRNSLGYFDHCKELTLACYDDKDLIFPEEVKERCISPLFDLKHLKVIMNKIERGSYTNLVDSILWLSPRLETLCIASGYNEKSMKFEYGKAKAEEDPFCCRGKPIKCWKHYLRVVTMNNFEGSVVGDNLERYFRMNAEMLDKVCYDKL